MLSPPYFAFYSHQSITNRTSAICKTHRSQVKFWAKFLSLKEIAYYPYVKYQFWLSGPLNENAKSLSLKLLSWKTNKHIGYFVSMTLFLFIHHDGESRDILYLHLDRTDQKINYCFFNT